MPFLLIAIVLLTRLQAPTEEPVGRPEAGKAFLAGTALSPCVACHGRDGEGGYGPDLAGTRLSFAQFRRAVRVPWGVMPAYTVPQVSDQQLADLRAYFQGLPKAAAPKASAWQGTPQELNSRAVWRVIVPAPLPVLPGASLGQRMAMSGAGCAQCHGPDMDNPRRWAGGAGGDYAWLTSIVYNEGSRSVEAAKDMGTYSRARLPEASLREIWNYMNGELGLRAFMSARAERGAAAGTNATYSVRVRNEGVSGKGLAAEDVQVSLALAPGVTVLAQTGPGAPAGSSTVT